MFGLILSQVRGNVTNHVTVNGTAVGASEGLITVRPTKTPRTAIPKRGCHHQPLRFQDLGQRQIVADFSGGYLSSDGGVLLRRQMDPGLGLTRTLAQAFTDRRDPRSCDHTLQELLAQRLHGLALGSEDLNDHNPLRHDPLGRDRLHEAAAGGALAGSATLNRLELGNHRHDRWHGVVPRPQRLLITLRPLRRVVGLMCWFAQCREQAYSTSWPSPLKLFEVLPHGHPT